MSAAKTHVKKFVFTSPNVDADEKVEILIPEVRGGVQYATFSHEYPEI